MSPLLQSSIVSVWFEGINDDTTATPAILRHVKEVEDAHDKFRRLIDRLIGKGDARASILTKEDLLAQLQNFRPCDGPKFTHARRQEADSALESSVQGSLKKVGPQAQRFTISFAHFIEAYSGVVSLLQNAGATDGRVAYDTLSLFLAVISNKKSDNKNIVDVLTSLTLAFPRIDVLLSMHPSPTLEACVASVYTEVIVFAREMTETFGSRNPPSTRFDIKATGIKDQLARISGEAMIQLHARNREISEQVKALVEKVTRLEQESARGQERILQVPRCSSAGIGFEVRRTNHVRRIGSDSALGKTHDEIKGILSPEEDKVRREQRQRESVLHPKGSDHMRPWSWHRPPDQKSGNESLVGKGSQLAQLKRALDLPADFHQRTKVDVDVVFTALNQQLRRASAAYTAASPFTRNLLVNRGNRYISQRTILEDLPFQAWCAAQESLLLFISGRTKGALGGQTGWLVDTSWLSPAAVIVAKHLIKSGAARLTTESSSEDASVKVVEPSLYRTSTSIGPRQFCIYYSCHPDASADRIRSHEATKPFRAILWSICGWSRTPLHHAEDMQSRVERLIKERVDDRKAVVEGLTTLIVSLLEDLPDPDATIWIILNRPDQCNMMTRYIMEQLTRLLTCKGPRIKIFVVGGRGHHNEWKPSDCDSLEIETRKRVIFRDSWDEPTLRRAERITAPTEKQTPQVA